MKELTDKLMEELLKGMEELAYRQCWRCDPDDYETKRLIMKPRESYGKEDLHWFCPDCKTYYNEVTEDEIKKENDMTNALTAEERNTLLKEAITMLKRAGQILDEVAGRHEARMREMDLGGQDENLPLNRRKNSK